MQIPGTRQELRFARRTCGSLASPSDDSSGQLGRWQNDADYSDCKLSANNLFDPTDELVSTGAPLAYQGYLAWLVYQLQIAVAT